MLNQSKVQHTCTWRNVIPGASSNFTTIPACER